MKGINIQNKAHSWLDNFLRDQISLGAHSTSYKMSTERIANHPSAVASEYPLHPNPPWIYMIYNENTFILFLKIVDHLGTPPQKHLKFKINLFCNTFFFLFLFHSNRPPL